VLSFEDQGGKFKPYTPFSMYEYICMYGGDHIEGRSEVFGAKDQLQL